MSLDAPQREPAPSAPSAPMEELAVPAPQSEKPEILSVSDINKAAKMTLESKYRQVWVKGELSNFKAHSSGHWYFSLKDSKAQISGAMFRGSNQGLKFKPRDGMEVIVRGRITLFEARGSYQIACDLMEPVGAGALQLQFEELKKKLNAEGLFDPKRKRPIPSLPQHVVVVTSPTGAAIRDILNVLGRRFKGLRVTLIPAVVQGDAAPAAIMRAIQLAHQLPDVDVMIVGRGGGSIEDMWCFNDERVARAISASRIPTISAVGHEIDFTIADFVADLRAPTPSAAAELVCRNAAEIVEKIHNFNTVLLRVFRHHSTILRQRLAHASRMLVDPKRRLQEDAQKCDDLAARLRLCWSRCQEKRGDRVEALAKRLPTPERKILMLRQQVLMQESRLEGQIKNVLQHRRSRVAEMGSVLDSISPLRVLDRGFSIARKEGVVVRAHDQIKKGDRLTLRLAKGEADVIVDKVNPGGSNGI